MLLLITRPSYTPLGISGIRDLMFDYLVDDKLICVFYSRGISWVVEESFEMTDVGYVLRYEVTDCVNIFISATLTFVIS